MVVENLNDLENTVHEMHDQMLLVSDGVEANDLEQASNSLREAQTNMEEVRVYLAKLIDQSNKGT